MFGHLGYSYCKLEHFKIPERQLTLGRMELVRRAGNEPPLIGLLRVFKDYYPDVIVGDSTAGRASVFKVCNFPYTST